MVDEDAAAGGGLRPRGALNGVARLMSRFSDLLFPPVCLGCGVMTAGHNALCAKCWTSIQLIEQPYCAVLGVPLARDEGEGMVSAAAIARPPPFSRLRSAVVYEGRARDLVQALKYRDRTDLAPAMAGWMLRTAAALLEDCDAIVPVPLHRFRLVRRSFNQSAELARALSHQSGTALFAHHLERVRRTRRQVGLGAVARQDNVRGAFRVNPSRVPDIAGRRIVLVDDVYTTGATVAAATRALQKAGAAEVSVLTFAMALPDGARAERVALNPATLPLYEA